MRVHTAVALLCLISTVLPASAQTSLDAQPPTLSSQSTLVLVPALVRDKSGTLVFTLKANDFVLTDDGIPQKLTLERDTGSEPLALVVLIEANSASKSSGWRPNKRDAPPNRYRTLTTMIDALAGNVPRKIAVVAFDSQPTLLQEFTSDIGSVGDAIDDVSTADTGDYAAAILDGINFSVDLLRKQPAEYRRAILLVSETNHRGSKITLDDALHIISDTNTAIYSFAYSTGNTDAARYAHRQLPTKASDQCPAAPSGGFSLLCLENANPGPPHGCMGKNDPNKDTPKNKETQAYDCLGLLVPPLALAKMAAIAASADLRRNIPQTVSMLTGGEYFKLTDTKSLETSLLIISNHIPNRYVLTFQPQSPHPGFHAVALTVPAYAHLEVAARNGYWANTAPAPGK